MLGAIVGDVIGSAYEFHPTKRTDFKLFTPFSKFTDDTVCTLAIAEALTFHRRYDVSLLHWCRRYPDAGYGKKFKEWFLSDTPEQGCSFGNGSAMRVSPLGYMPFEEEEMLRMAKETALPTHAHPEGIKGAKAVALAVRLATTSNKKPTFKEELKARIEADFGYDLSTPIDEIRPTYAMDATCQGSVPQAIRAFMESSNFESAVRLAVSLGGDADTQASIAGAIAHAYYRVIPKMLVVETLQRLPDHFVRIIHDFNHTHGVSW